MTTRATQVLKIMIVDDHPLVRKAVRWMLEAEPDLSVCCEKEDATSALECIRKCRPDLALVDITLKGSNGLLLIRDLQQRYPDLPALVLSMHEESLYAERALRAGARGYIMKHEATERVVEAIRKVLKGEVYLSDRMSGRLVPEGEIARGRKSPMDALTDRELEVFRLIGGGKTTRQIAKKLHLSGKTVESHREHIKQKLDLKNATELVQQAILWVQVEDPS